MHHVARVLLIWLLCLLCILLHELGHALGYRNATGKTGWRILVGSGPEILSMAKCTFCLIPVGGYFVPKEELKTKKEELTMLVCGPIVSLLLATLFYVCHFYLAGLTQPGSELHEVLVPVSSFLMFFNFYLFLFTTIPMRYRIVCRGLESDGLQIIHALKDEEA